MQKKHFRILVAAACLCAGLSFSAYGEETISSVPLSFSWDGAPKGGEAVGTLTATTTSQSFIVEGSEYLKDDDTWDYGEWPCAEIELSAAEGYRFSTPNRRTFSLSGCNVQYKSSEIDSDGSTLILQVYLSRIGGQLPKITDLSWSGKNAVWDNIEGCDGYEVCLKKDGKTLVTVTSKGTSYDFSDYINNAGSYVFTVRAVSTYGSQNTPAPFDPELKPGNGWDLWKKIAAQDASFGRPEKFCYDPEQSNWMSATVTTLDDKIPQYIQKICKRDPFSGHTVTGGIVTVKDSSWLMSWTLNRQQQFRDQPKDQLCVWVYGLFSDKPGDYVKKPMRDCTGKEICMEWLYHMGVPESEIEELAEHSANTVPVMMPYITAFFMPRAAGDRPDVVPKGAVNFAFLGQFAEVPRDTIFTTEYSMRTAMVAVYTLLNVDRGVPEVWGSTYDIRDLLNATVQLRDGKKITDLDLPLMERLALKEVLKKVSGTDIEKLLKEYHCI